MFWGWVGRGFLLSFCLQLDSGPLQLIGPSWPKLCGFCCVVCRFGWWDEKVIGILPAHSLFCMEQGLGLTRGCHNYPHSLWTPAEAPLSLLHEVVAAGQEQQGVTVKSGDQL